jgi:hypothetical protein
MVCSSSSYTLYVCSSFPQMVCSTYGTQHMRVPHICLLHKFPHTSAPYLSALVPPRWSPPPHTGGFPTSVCSSFPHMSDLVPPMVCSTSHMRVPHICLLWFPTDDLLRPPHAGSTHLSAVVSHRWSAPPHTSGFHTYVCSGFPQMICPTPHMRVPHICLLWLLTYVCSGFPQMVFSTPHMRAPHIYLLWFPTYVCSSFPHMSPLVPKQVCSGSHRWSGFFPYTHVQLCFTHMSSLDSILAWFGSPQMVCSRLSHMSALAPHTCLLLLRHAFLL